MTNRDFLENCKMVDDIMRKVGGHKHLDLSPDSGDINYDSDRPNISLWHDADSPEFSVAVSIGATWGAQQRYLSLKPIEARRLANLLMQVSDEAEPGPGPSAYLRGPHDPEYKQT